MTGPAKVATRPTPSRPTSANRMIPSGSFFVSWTALIGVGLGLGDNGAVLTERPGTGREVAVDGVVAGVVVVCDGVVATGDGVGVVTGGLRTRFTARLVC